MKRMRSLDRFLVPCVVVAVAGWGLTAQAASFDCSKAATPREKAVCASPALGAVDEKLAATYKAALAEQSTEAAEGTRHAQREWLKSLDRKCAPGGPDYSDCLAAAYAMRLRELQQMPHRVGRVMFTWRKLHLTEPDDADTAQMDKERGAAAYGTIDVSRPEAAADSPEWLAWNKAIESAARDLANTEEGRKPSTEWKKEWARNTDIRITATVNAVTDQMVSASLWEASFGHGAAHGSTAYPQFNWLLKEQRELKPEDVFRANSGWQQALYERTDRYLHQALDDSLGEDYQKWQQPGEEAKAVHRVVENPSNWRIDSDGLTILFPEYSVACYACTPQPFTVGWNEMKPLMRDGFEVPR
jgi:uncharacterized protein